MSAGVRVPVDVPADLAGGAGRVLAGLADVAAGRAPGYLVARVLVRSGYIAENPDWWTRHGVAGVTESDAGHIATCRCGHVSPVCLEHADDDGEIYDGELWAQAAIDVHTSESRSGVPVYVFTPTGSRFYAAARRFGSIR